MKDDELRRIEREAIAGYGMSSEATLELLRLLHDMNKAFRELDALIAKWKSLNPGGVVNQAHNSGVEPHLPGEPES